MIRVSVENYCNECRYFEADVTNPTVIRNGIRELVIGDTIIECTHRELCERLAEYLKEKE